MSEKSAYVTLSEKHAYLTLHLAITLEIYNRLRQQISDERRGYCEEEVTKAASSYLAELCFEGLDHFLDAMDKDEEESTP